MNLTRATRLDNPVLVDVDTGLLYGLGPQRTPRPYMTSVVNTGAVCWLTDCDATTLDELAAWLQARTEHEPVCSPWGVYARGDNEWTCVRTFDSLDAADAWARANLTEWRVSQP